jgi:hypothetical protein
MSAPVSPLSALLNHFRQAAQTEREKGTYFEELIVTYRKCNRQDVWQEDVHLLKAKSASYCA